MSPRVFISSTYYDLKHLRERLESFIENYGFEPILFEKDKVTYQQGKTIEDSVYGEVSLCQIMILIIGGRYGTLSNNESKSEVEDEMKKIDEITSITKREYDTAKKLNLPILIFIDKNVYAEYQTYKLNQEYLNDNHEDENNIFKFAHVDHINIFKFINEVVYSPIKTFEKVEEIENYLKSQFAGWFYLYLQSLKSEAENNNILNSISDLNNISLRMNEMLNTVGKEILSNKQSEYEKVIKNQLIIVIKFFVELFEESIVFKNYLPIANLTQDVLKEITNIIYNDSIKITLPYYGDKLKYEEILELSRNYNKDLIVDINSKLQKVNPLLLITEYKFRRINSAYHNKVKPFIKNQSDLKILLDEMIRILDFKLADVPF